MGKLCKQKTQPAEHETDAPTIDQQQQQQQQHQQQQHEAALEVAFSSKNSVKTKEKKTR